MNHSSRIDTIFNDTLNRYTPMIRRICVTYSSQRVSADDLFQEVTIALWLGLKSFSGKASLTTWLYRVAINTCISYLRRTDTRTLCRPDYLFEDIPDDEAAYGDDEFAYLGYLIERLKPIDKAIILMWLDELSYAEISDVTGLSVNVVGTRLNRIRERLHNLSKKEMKK